MPSVPVVGGRLRHAPARADAVCGSQASISRAAGYVDGDRSGMTEKIKQGSSQSTDTPAGYVRAVVLGVLAAACMLGLRDMANVTVAMVIYLVTGKVWWPL